MTCHHESIRHFRFEDGKPAPLWSCAQCGRRFAPLAEDPKFDFDRLTETQAALRDSLVLITKFQAEIDDLKSKLIELGSTRQG